MEKLPEVWLRGQIDKVPALLQPVAHALKQANEEIHAMLQDFPPHLIWERPAGVASVAFHLQHIPGVLDRLFTYSKGETLTNAQLKYLSEEGLEDSSITIESLLKHLDENINHAVNQLRSLDPGTLVQQRFVGRKRLPSTVLGLLFHAAEHTMRHTGQLLVTAKILMNEESEN